MLERGTRRDALARLATWLCGGMAAALGLVPPLRSVLGAAARVEEPSKDLSLGPLSDLTVEPRQIWLRGEVRDGWVRLNEELGSVWVARTDGGVRVLSSICPHLGCEVDWDGGARRFFCPCHDSAFAADGRVLSGPAPRPMDELSARVDAGQVFCRWQRFAPGRAVKQET
jgi:menaquinol-cytochrome c reductase iron-sulfur subunit